MTTITDQETFWQGDFGNAYTARTRGSHWVASNVSFFSNVLKRTHNVRTVLELGANIGLNLMALRQVLPEAKLSAVEINEQAVSELKANLPDADVHLASILGFQPVRTWNMVFSKNVLIHINPDALPSVYGLMHRSSDRYLLVAEYYNPSPVEVVYRGHAGKLFKRDFAGEIMDAYPDLVLVDYGFVYRRDPNFPQDDVSWFLLEKT